MRENVSNESHDTLAFSSFGYSVIKIFSERLPEIGVVVGALERPLTHVTRRGSEMYSSEATVWRQAATTRPESVRFTKILPLIDGNDVWLRLCFLNYIWSIQILYV